MRRKLFNVILLFVSFCLMLTVTFGWWIEGVVSDSFVIKSAKISSEITIYQGNDFNHDGNLDKTDPFELLKTTEKNKKQVLVLNFSNLAPTEVYTWKIKVENNGDAAGFVYATLFEPLLKKEGIADSAYRKYIKFMSITQVPQYAYYLTSTTNQDGTVVKSLSGDPVLMQYNIIETPTGEKYVYNGLTYDIYKDADGKEYFVKLEPEKRTDKIYLYNATATTALFGNTTSDVVEIGQAKEYVFQIQLETYENLVAAGIIEDNSTNYADYQALQGTTNDLSFEFLDVSLSGTLLGDDSTTANALS